MTNLYKRHIKRLKLVSVMIIFLLSISAGKTVDYFRFLKGMETGENKQLEKLK